MNCDLIVIFTLIHSRNLHISHNTPCLLAQFSTPYLLYQTPRRLLNF